MTFMTEQFAIVYISFTTKPTFFFFSLSIDERSIDRKKKEDVLKEKSVTKAAAAAQRRQLRCKLMWFGNSSKQVSSQCH